jgi:predicted SAM-dependent methyltransferase
MKSIDCIFSEKRFEFLILPDEIREGARESGNYRILRLNGQLHYSREGTVFGILKIS